MKLFVEQLEDRQMLSASVSLSAAGVLAVVADNKGDYIIVEPNGTNIEVLLASEQGKTALFAAASVKSITFQGGSGKAGDYFANLTALPSTQQAGNNSGVNSLQGGTGNDTLTGSPNSSAATYLTDPGGSNTLNGGAGFSNIFLGGGTDAINLRDNTFNAVYSILAKNTIAARGGRGYIIVNAGSVFTAGVSPGYQVVTFFQPGVSGNAPGVPGGPSAVLQKDVNGNGILYVNAASGQTSTSFFVNPSDDGSKIVVTYGDPKNGTKTFTFSHDAVQWIASFGPTGSNNVLVNNTDIDDVLYGGLPPGNHTVTGGFGINVLKGHSGTNTITARGTYNDVTAGNGTDSIVLQESRQPEASYDDREMRTDPRILAQGDVIRANTKTVSTTITGFKRGDTVTGVPLSINGTKDSKDTDTVADDADYVFWSLFLRRRKSI